MWCSSWGQTLWDSAAICQAILSQHCRMYSTNFHQNIPTLNRYFKLLNRALWNEVICHASPTLTPNLQQIQRVQPFNFILHEFYECINEHMSANETCIMVTYCGETCNLTWIWKHTQAPRMQLYMPLQMKLLMGICMSLEVQVPFFYEQARVTCIVLWLEAHYVLYLEWRAWQSWWCKITDLPCHWQWQGFLG